MVHTLSSQFYFLWWPLLNENIFYYPNSCWIVLINIIFSFMSLLVYFLMSSLLFLGKTEFIHHLRLVLLLTLKLLHFKQIKITLKMETMLWVWHQILTGMLLNNFSLDCYSSSRDIVNVFVFFHCLQLVVLLKMVLYQSSRSRSMCFMMKLIHWWRLG
jgi:hypothetical protein